MPKFYLIVAIPILLYGLVSCANNEDHSASLDAKPSYATWYGTGPDKWASIWLATRFLDGDSTVEIFPEGIKKEGYTFFDIPDVPLNRTKDKASLEILLDNTNVDDAGARQVAAIIHDIDIRLWQGYEHPLSYVVEQGYRALQARYGKEQVPVHCYLGFFDSVAALPIDSAEEINPENLLPPETCGQQVLTSNATNDMLVPELPISELFSSMASGTSVLFIDVREADEYAEGHLPGAINMPLRELNEGNVSTLPKADIVIPYCVKDFRGYEMARKLQRLGVENVALLKPYGLKGWLKEKLPVVEGDQPDSPAATMALQECISRNKNCARYL